MSTPTPNDYATLLAEARIAALHALTDILATSKDPKERRLAAAAILRVPNPDPPSRTPDRRQYTQTSQEQPTPPAALTPPAFPNPLAFTFDLNDDPDFDIKHSKFILFVPRRRHHSPADLLAAVGHGHPT